MNKNIKAIELLQDYKDNGDRVDEVLFQVVSKELFRLRTVMDQKNYSIDLIGEQKMELFKENKKLRESLQKACDSLGADIEDYLPE